MSGKTIKTTFQEVIRKI